MADKIVTAQKLKDADKDCDALDQAVSGGDSEYVKTRRGKEYPTMPNAIRQIMENGGFMPFATEVELLAYVPNISPSAAKAMDTKKVWLWKDNGWYDTGLSELEQSKEIINKLKKEINKITPRNNVAINSLAEMLLHISIENNAANSAFYSKLTASNNEVQKLFVSTHGLSDSISSVLRVIGDFFKDKSKLERLRVVHELTAELTKLDQFDPQKSGNNSIVFEDTVFFPTPTQLIKIDITTDEKLPNAKGKSISTLTSINVDGQIFESFGTIEVQGSSSAYMPKKNWTIALFSDVEKFNAINIKLGQLMAFDEIVFKSNFIDTTQARNIATNRLWDRMQMSRLGFPKREVDFVNMIQKNPLTVQTDKALDLQPTGAIGHVDGYPAVMYLNNEFYGLGTLNIGKKRGNYNLKKDNQKHIQLEPEGGFSLNNLPTSPLDENSALEIRRPATWGDGAQASWDRFCDFMKLDQAGMEAAGIDNYIDRSTMIDYIILCNVCNLVDHIHKNTLMTTWDGEVWHFLPYDVDMVFGLDFQGRYINIETGLPYYPPEMLLIKDPPYIPRWNSLLKFRKIYGVELDDRYAFLRRNNIISSVAITSLCEEINRKFTPELHKLEDKKWNFGGAVAYDSLVQSSSLFQIYEWLQIHIPVCDKEFNFKEEV